MNKNATPAKGQPFKASNTVSRGFENTEVRAQARAWVADNPIAFELGGDKHLVFCFMQKRVYYDLSGVHCKTAEERAAVQATNAEAIVKAKAELDRLLVLGGWVTKSGKPNMSLAKTAGRAIKRHGKTLFDCYVNENGQIVLCGE